jgi:nitrogen regulatory protein PII
MKMVIAYINPFKLEEIEDALKETGVTGLSAENIQGFGRQAGHTGLCGAEYEVDFVPKVRIEVLVDDTSPHRHLDHGDDGANRLDRRR